MMPRSFQDDRLRDDSCLVQRVFERRTSDCPVNTIAAHMEMTVAVEPGSAKLAGHATDGAGAMVRWLTLISIASLAPPVAWILTHDLHAAPTGDAFYFQVQASLIADGSGWFISPFPYLLHHAVVQSAQHPPLWLLVLAFADTIGLHSFLAHLFFACVLGAAAVFVTGLAGREVAGPRVGLIAAAIAAVYPNYWINDTNGLSETFVLLLVSAVVFAVVSVLAPARAPRGRSGWVRSVRWRG